MLTKVLLEDLERESERTRRVLAEIPAHKSDWKPHERSMALGHLSQMVATIPSWIAMEISLAELDVMPASGSQHRPAPMETSEALLAGHDKAMADARQALTGTTDEHLATNWKMLAAGKVVAEEPRSVFIRDTISHWAHHRGQLTVYLRLMGAKVPSIYGPSADDSRFL